MLLELASIAAGSVTVITVASLRLVSVLDKRERDDDKREREDAETDSFTLDEPVVVAPFVDIRVGTKCPHCGFTSSKDRGLRAPKACKIGDTCKATGTPHIHVRCTECRARWAMGKESEPPPAGNVEILPFRGVFIGTPCQKCGSRAENNREGTSCIRGPTPPKACDSKRCAARDRPHLHMHCLTCEAKWLMATANSDKIA